MARVNHYLTQESGQGRSFGRTAGPPGQTPTGLRSDQDTIARDSSALRVHWGGLELTSAISSSLLQSETSFGLAHIRGNDSDRGMVTFTCPLFWLILHTLQSLVKGPGEGERRRSRLNIPP